jgi:hypothetical protein
MRVVVSTNTINLQDQLLEKDVPDLLRATGLPARVTVLKGRANYLCLRRWLTLFKSEDLGPGERMLLIRTLLWLSRTSTGDRAELRLSPEEDEAWSKVAAAAEVCSPLRCSYHREGSCFVARARRAADGAHVVIVNHSLLLSDVVTGNQVLPEYRHLVVDEAHHLEDPGGSPSWPKPAPWAGSGCWPRRRARWSTWRPTRRRRRSTGVAWSGAASTWSGSEAASTASSRCSARSRASRTAVATGAARSPSG